MPIRSRAIWQASIFSGFLVPSISDDREVYINIH
jgi:hypothetical protein